MTISSFSKHQRTWLRWCPALFCAIIIFYFSSMLGDEVEKTYNSLDTIGQPTSTASATAKPPTPTMTLTPPMTATTLKAGAIATALPISGPISENPIFSTWDSLKTGHAIGYFWLGWMVLYALGLQSRRSPAIAVILCALYAISDEFHQRFVPGRSASTRDVLIDTMAALVGVTALFALIRAWGFFKQVRAPVSSPPSSADIHP